VHLIEVESGKLLRTIRPSLRHSRPLFYTDGNILSSGRDTQVRICQVEDGKELAALGKPRGGQFTDWIHAISLQPISAGWPPPISRSRADLALSGIGRFLAHELQRS